MVIVKNAKNSTFCWDCKKEIEIKDKEIKNGKVLFFKDGEKEINIFKCNECFEKNQELKNYQPCEVYSRIVGYLRPVQQWNMGKQEEFKNRKKFKIKKVA